MFCGVKSKQLVCFVKHLWEHLSSCLDVLVGHSEWLSFFHHLGRNTGIQKPAWPPLPTRKRPQWCWCNSSRHHFCLLSAYPKGAYPQPWSHLPVPLLNPMQTLDWCGYGSMGYQEPEPAHTRSAAPTRLHRHHVVMEQCFHQEAYADHERPRHQKRSMWHVQAGANVHGWSASDTPWPAPCRPSCSDQVLEHAGPEGRAVCPADPADHGQPEPQQPLCRLGAHGHQPGLLLSITQVQMLSWGLHSETPGAQ